MIANERQQKILDYLAARKNASVSELLELLDTSESTLRRDLMVLERQGRCERVHGGVSLLNRDYSEDSTLEHRRHEFSKEKKEIGKRAAQMVSDGDLIYVDAGTTTEALLEQLAGKKVHVVTNSINHAALASRLGLEVTLVGGSFKTITDAIVGEEALSFLEKYSFDCGFFGANAIGADGSLLTPDLREAAVKNKALRSCKTVYLLADSSKLSKSSKIRFGKLDQVILVSDEDPDTDNALVLSDLQERSSD